MINKIINKIIQVFVYMMYVCVYSLYLLCIHKYMHTCIYLSKYSKYMLYVCVFIYT